MLLASSRQSQLQQSDTGRLIRIGGWLFRRRSIIPLPFALVVLFTPSSTRISLGMIALGVGLVAVGEWLRLWGVHHIGVISRTRSDRLGPLIDSGPFSVVRNPLYLGNIALWAGLALAANLLWLAPIVAVILALEYHAIVRWEERLLEQRLGETYRTYAARVPRWLPSFHGGGHFQAAITTSTQPFTWGETLYSERSTLVAIAAGFVLLWVKTRL